MNGVPFDRIVVDGEVADRSFTREFLDRVPASVPVATRREGMPVPKGRRVLHVTREHGSFLKPCPCSPGMVRCGYWVLTPSFQCPFSCSYCFLRFYAPDAPLTLYANLEEAAREFREALHGWAGPVRLGTGEFADSLALDPWTRHSQWLRDLVRPHDRVILELKTKSDQVGVLLARSPEPNVVIAWSVNPESWVASEEPGSATLVDRLKAARAVADAGFRVAFHLDPIVLGEGWESGYEALARALFEAVPAARIAWVSLGTLRFPPRFLEEWGSALRHRRYFFGEFVPGGDGKLRYFWPDRRAVLRRTAAMLRRWGGEDLRLYLCMESEAMWGSALGWKPEEEEIVRYLGA